VGPADVSVDRSTQTVIGQRSKGSVGLVGPAGQRLPEADRWGPRSGRLKRKIKRARFGSGPKGCWAGSRPSQARLGFTGHLGLRLSMPARSFGWLGMYAGPRSVSPLSLCQAGLGGSAPRFPRQVGPACRSHSGSSVATKSGVAGSGVCACV
jgi:hypothetical protein